MLNGVKELLLITLEVILQPEPAYTDFLDVPGCSCLNGVFIFSGVTDYCQWSRVYRSDAG